MKIILYFLRYHISKVMKNSMFCGELLYLDFLWKVLSLVQKQGLSKSFELYTICIILKNMPKVIFPHFIYKTQK